MTVELLLLIALITYASRMLALAVLPPMPPRIAMVLERMPTALFAGLAVNSLVRPGPELADPAVLAAAAGAVIVAPLRSLAVCLVAGIAAYILVTLVS